LFGLGTSTGSEVGKFEFRCGFVDKNIFRLDITMKYTAAMYMIQRSKKLTSKACS